MRSPGAGVAQPESARQATGVIDCHFVMSHESKVPRAPRVLCAEDDSAVAVALKRAIENTGCSVDWVRDGADAFARITQNGTVYDVLVTDHEMPKLSGLGLVSKLRDTGFAGAIIVFSSRLKEADVQVYRALAVDRILEKPASLRVLMDALREVMEPPIQ